MPPPASFVPGRNVLDALRGSRIFFAGGTGFLGSWMTRVLAEAPYPPGERPEVVLLTRTPDLALERSPWLRTSGFSVLKGDALAPPPIAGRFDFFIHGAADARAPLVAGGAGFLAEGTRRLFALPGRLGVTRALYVSSGAVYGPPAEAGPISESKTFASLESTPTGDYGSAKRLSEEISANKALEDGFSLAIARCFAFAGPGLPLDAHYAVGNFVRQAISGGPIEVATSGRSIRSYLHPGDAARWMWTMLTRSGPPRAFNVGSPDPIDILSLAHEVADLAGGLPVLTGMGQPRSGAPDCYYPDIARAEKELGVEVTVSRSQALAEMLDWGRDRKGDR